MLKIIKWEFIKNIKSMKLLYSLAILPPLLLAVLVLLALLVFLPVQETFFIALPICLLTAVSIFILYKIVVSFAVDDLSKTAKLECMTNAKFFQVIVSKLLINIVMFAFIALLLFLSQKFAMKFNTENERFEIELSESLWILALLFTFIYPSVVAFIYYAITSIPVFRNIKVVVLVIILIAGFIMQPPLNIIHNKLIFYSCLSIIAVCSLVGVGWIKKLRRS